MAKQPREIERPNTRLNRAYGKKPQNDLQQMGNRHYENASNIAREVSKDIPKGWEFYAEGVYGDERPQFKYGDDYIYDIKTKKIHPYGLIKKDRGPIPQPPKYDENLFNKMKEQIRLGDLAWASDQFGRDLYHDADLRSGNGEYPKDLKQREGWDLESYSDDDLLEKLREYDAYLETVPDSTWDLRKDDADAYRAIEQELDRRRKEREGK